MKSDEVFSLWPAASGRCDTQPTQAQGINRAKVTNVIPWDAALHRDVAHHGNQWKIKMYILLSTYIVLISW